MRHHPRRFALEALEPRDVPAAHLAAVGTSASGIGQAQLVDTATGQPRYSVFPFGTGYFGEVRVAAGDVNGDGVTDLIAAPGAGGGPVVKVFDGVTGVELRSQLLFDPDFRGGLYVAAADTNLDGFAEVIAGAGEGGGPAVAVVDGATGATTASFFAYESSVRGGVRVAAGDVDGDGRADVITGAGPGGAPHVRAFNVAAGGREVASFFAYDPAFAGGVYVAAADFDLDGLGEIVTGTGAGGGPVVNVLRADGSAVSSFLAADAGLRAGVRVGTIDTGTGFTSDIATVVPGAEANVAGRFDATGARLDSPLLTGAWVGGTPEAAPDAALLWNRVALRTITLANTPPPAAARALAMTQLAVYDAVNNIQGRYSPYFFSVGAADGADPEAAALVAGGLVLSGLYPDRAAEFDRVRDANLALIPESQAKADGLQAGFDAAGLILSLRSFDGSDQAADFPYTPGTDPGDWRPTPPANAPFLLPGWGNVSRFATPFGSFAPPGPPGLASAEYAAALDEVKRLGRVDSTERTAEQTEIARFWRAGPGTHTPPGMTNVIAQAAVRRAGLDLLDSARALALVNLAEADAGIVCWDAKLAFDFWRPITAIRLADTDDNPDTVADPTWTPLFATPNFPDYTSGHATFSAAGAAVLESLFGADFAFRTYSQDLPGVSRAFSDFFAAADEAAVSRVYGGIHFSFASADGLQVGAELGAFVAANSLRPVT